MKTYRLALIGFGNVGQGLAHILAQNSAFYAETFGITIQIVAVSDLLKGAVYNPDGLAAQALLDAVAAEGNINSVPAPYTGWDAEKTITESRADVIVELSYTDLASGEPATGHIRTALAQGKHVITSNKGPIALHYPELAALALKTGARLGVEGTVMSGTPALHLGMDTLRAAGIQQIQGILNGTTNYILTRMEAGDSYEDALADAQARGYAEADPSGDVDGHDAAGKVVILANLLLGAQAGMDDVDRTGITGLSPADIEAAQAAGKRWKLIGTVARTDDGLALRVKPVQIDLSHPLASVSGATNAITYTTDILGDVTLVGPGAGRLETGYALIADLLAIHRSL